LLGWEAMLPGVGRPQARINADVDKCDLFVGVVHKRWGSPSGEYSSGFEEEFTRALDRNTRTESPDLWQYFIKIEERDLDDTGPQLERVLQFKARIEEDKICLYKSFESTQEFKDEFRRNVQQHIMDILGVSEEEIESSAEETVGKPKAVEESQTSQSSETGSAFSQGAVETLATTATQVAGDYSPAGISALQNARISLVAVALASDRYSDRFLDIHEGNSIYTHRANVELGWKERLELVRSSLKWLPHPYIPLWNWLATEESPLTVLAQLASSDDSTEVQVGALQVLLSCEPELDDIVPESRETWLTDVLTSDTASVRTQAMKLLKAVGKPEDLRQVVAEVERNDYQTRTLAQELHTELTLRTSASDALNLLVEKDYEVSDQMLQRLFSADLEEFSDESLSDGTTHRSAKVRRQCAEELLARGRLTLEQQERLKNDPSALPKVAVAKAILDRSEELSYRGINSLVADKGGDNSGGLGGLFSMQLPSPDEATAREEVKKFKHSKLARPDLELMAEMFEWEGPGAYGELATRFFDEESERIRRDYDDRFSTHYAESEAKLVERVGEEIAKQSTKTFEPMLTIMRDRFIMSAIGAIANKGDETDKFRVTDYVSRIDNTVSEHTRICLFGYFERHGTFDDLASVVQISRVPGVSLLTVPSLEFTDSRSNAILAIMKNHPERLFDVNMLDNDISRVISGLPEEQFIQLENSIIMFALNYNDNSVRRAMSRRLALLKSRNELLELNTQYGSQENIYYDVRYYLDAAVFEPREINRQLFIASPKDGAIR
jgi:hypothetical protein